MICLTESLLASLGEKIVPTTSDTFSGYETNHGENTNHIEGVTDLNKAPATSMVSSSLAPAASDISSSHTLYLKRSSGGFWSAAGAEQYKSDGVSCAEQYKSDGVSLTESRGLKEASLIEISTTKSQRLDGRQVIMDCITCLCSQYNGDLKDANATVSDISSNSCSSKNSK
jgi:hypothetical protein